LENNIIKSFIVNLFPKDQNLNGKGILKLKMELPFLNHILFSLLKGRPVVIYGNPENQDLIVDMINSLSIFVPGRYWILQSPNSIDKETNLHLFDNESFGIQNWSNDPIKNLELNHLKLIGLSKKVQIQKSIQRYVTIFDFEKKLLISPKYNGKILDSIFNKKFSVCDWFKLNFHRMKEFIFRKFF
jgi:hypothetical protein